MLSLAEEIFLLSLIEKKDSVQIPSSLSLPFSLAGAAIIELALSGNVKIEDGRVMPCGEPEQITDERLKFALEKICQIEKTRKLDYWVYLLGTKGKRILKGTILSLIEKGILLEEGKYYRWSAEQNENCPEKVPSKYLLKRDIRDAVYCGETISERFLACLVLLDACSMLEHLFTKDEMIAVRKRIKLFKNQTNFSPSFLDLLSKMAEAIEYSIASAITT